MSTAFHPDVLASPLGRQVEAPYGHRPELLYGLPRRPKANDGAVAPHTTFFGFDVWTAYELSWCDGRGLPQQAVMELCIPAESPQLVESKSLKLYLGALFNERFADAEALLRLIVTDVGRCVGCAVSARVVPDVELSGGALEHGADGAWGQCLEAQISDAARFDACGLTPDATLLSTRVTEIKESVFTALFRSLCPVTGQPDWARLGIHYEGPAIEHEPLLRYMLSFRQHQDFHEACVEQIYAQIKNRCRPRRLSVYARYMRRGGIDINPLRADYDMAQLPPRFCRQ